ncbi:hypothetical protein [Armatimonas rosea]|uniref:Uncharacterized protein n=1 Tax=Armatimonas rosea TaxID=685828 RepID=A0A7W9SRE6_ARMRO|nr:hypothetical protein [Armatimonas rosea]MBB6051425.1 hypothetical protein [Armatimonas rosea]
MADQIPVCDLAEALATQEIEALVFLPFAIRCLQASNVEANQAQLSVRILQRDGIKLTKTLRVQWSQEHIPTLPPAVQSHIITEWGALGVACAVLHGLGDGLRLTSVAHEGDRFDYWVGNDEQEWGLEISGTGAESLEERHKEKVDQLLGNPYGVDGFVIVVRFASQEAWFTFHRVRERRVR